MNQAPTKSSPLIFKHEVEAPATKERPMFLPISKDLIRNANRARTPWQTLYDLGEELGGLPGVIVRFDSRKAANAAAKILDQLLKERHGFSPNTPVRRSPGKRKRYEIVCSAEEYMAAEHSIIEVCEDVAKTGEIYVSVKRSTRNIAKKYLELFEHQQSAGIDQEAGAGPEPLLNQVINKAHKPALKVLHCIREKSVTTRPKKTSAPGTPHEVTITGITPKVTIDKQAKRMNEAKRAALYTLAVLGTENVSTAKFAQYYNNRLLSNKNSKANPTNIFNQAMKGLKAALPRLEIAWTENTGHRNVLGIKITTNGGHKQLKTWLKRRRQETETAVRNWVARKPFKFVWDDKEEEETMLEALRTRIQRSKNRPVCADS